MEKLQYIFFCICDCCFLLICLDVCFRVIEYIFSEVEKHIETGDLISEYKMSALPSLSDYFVQLIKYLVRTLVCSNKIR